MSELVSNTADLLQTLLNASEEARYLELGCGPLPSVKPCLFQEVVAKKKRGVDPLLLHSLEGCLKLSPDSFFTEYSDVFDVICIDRQRHFEDLISCMVQAWEYLPLGGYLVCLNCLPHSSYYASRALLRNVWTSDCWRVLWWLKLHRPHIVFEVVSADTGCCLIKKTDQEIKLINDSEIGQIMQLEWSVERITSHELNIVNLNDFKLRMEGDSV